MDLYYYNNWNLKLILTNIYSYILLKLSMFKIYPADLLSSISVWLFALSISWVLFRPGH